MDQTRTQTMKHTILPALILLALASCKKEGNTITYRVACTGCHVSYVTSSEVYDRVSLYADTIMRVDSATLDTVPVVVQSEWTYSFDADHDQTATIELRHTSYAVSPSVAQVLVDGVVAASRSTDRAGETIVVSRP